MPETGASFTKDIFAVSALGLDTATTMDIINKYSFFGMKTCINIINFCKNVDQLAKHSLQYFITTELSEHRAATLFIEDVFKLY